TQYPRAVPDLTRTIAGDDGGFDGRGAAEEKNVDQLGTVLPRRGPRDQAGGTAAAETTAKAGRPPRRRLDDRPLSRQRRAGGDFSTHYLERRGPQMSGAR